MKKEIVKSNVIQGESTTQTPIEIMLDIDENGKTTARKLYEYLQLDKKNYSRWSKTNIEENKYAEENVDFVPFVINEDWGGAKTKDYKLTASFAKKLCMTSPTTRGEQARNYFIKVEDMLKEKMQNQRVMLPQDYETALENLLKQVRENNKLKLAIEENKPKLDMYEKLMNGKNALDMGEVAKAFGIGRNTLFKHLRDLEILMKNNIPYQKYMEQGYFKVLFIPVTMGNKAENKPKTVVFTKGLEYLHKKLIKAGILKEEIINKSTI